MEQLHDKKRPPPKRRVPARDEWVSDPVDKPHRDALEHARPPVKDARSGDFRDRETAVPERELRQAR